MLETTMLNNLKVLIPLPVNCIITLLIELEIIFIYVCVFLQSVKNSEIVLENSQHYLMNVQLTGSCLGHNKH